MHNVKDKHRHICDSCLQTCHECSPPPLLCQLLLTPIVRLQPLRVPGFAFAWLELMSHRSLMPKLLLAPNHKGWPSFQRLLLALLRFLEPYLRNAELTDAVRLLYKVCFLTLPLLPSQLLSNYNPYMSPIPLSIQCSVV